MKTAVLLLNFGEPEHATLKEVVPFLEKIFMMNASLEDASAYERALKRSQQLAPERAPGLIEEFRLPGGAGVRIDSHAYAGYRIPPNYDSMIGKLIVHRPTRAEAIATMKRALSEFHVAPIKTTIPLHLQIMDNPNFLSGDVDTGFIERVMLAK